MKNRGFTLVELTVVIAIIALLSTIFLANYREGERIFALQRSAHKLALDLRGTQEMAISAQEFEETFPKGGYGIYLEKDSNSYILFADCDGDDQYTPPAPGITSCEEATPESPFWKGEKIEELFLEDGIKISQFSLPGDSLIITFFPPDPEITFNAEPSITWASITLAVNGHTKKVYVYKTGLIEVK